VEDESQALFARLLPELKAKLPSIATEKLEVRNSLELFSELLTAREKPLPSIKGETIKKAIEFIDDDPHLSEILEQSRVNATQIGASQKGRAVVDRVGYIKQQLKANVRKNSLT
jgi:hypothetical protein